MRKRSDKSRVNNIIIYKQLISQIMIKIYNEIDRSLDNVALSVESYSEVLK